MKHILTYPMFERRDLEKDEETLVMVATTVREINRAIQQGDMVRGQGTFTCDTDMFELTIFHETYNKPQAQYLSPGVNGAFEAGVRLHSPALYAAVEAAMLAWEQDGIKPSVTLPPSVESALYHELVHMQDDFSTGGMLTKVHNDMVARQVKSVDARYKKYRKQPHLVAQSDATVRSIAKGDAQDDKFRIYANSDAETNAVFLQTATGLQPTGKFGEFWKSFVGKLPWDIGYYKKEVQKRFKKRLYDLYINKVEASKNPPLNPNI